MTLTIKKISAATEAGRYLDGQGLYLQITPSGARSWVFRYQRGARERMLGLGPLHTVDLAEARERARRARLQLLDGVDPIVARIEMRAAMALEAAKSITFEEATQQFFEQHEQAWRNAKHRAQFMSSLRQYALPVLGKVAVASIDTPLVLRILKTNRFWEEKTETANRVRGRIEAVLGWATVHGYRTGENPARWRGHLSEALPARGQIARVQHYRALPYTDLPGFMTELTKREGVGARALEFLILTVARTGEVVGAQWSEIDLGKKVWTIPAGRMKKYREHRVPLCDRAIEILMAVPREAAYVFPGGQKGMAISNMGMAVLLKRMERKDITVHGFRSTFKDWASERTSFAPEVSEMALAHVVGNKVEAAYRRGDLFAKRARLMAEWERYCLTPQTSAEVTPINRGSLKAAE